MSVPRVPRGSGTVVVTGSGSGGIGTDHHPPRHASEADFRTAADAMQRAAEAMVAATASFRQFAEGQSRGPSPSPDVRHSTGDPRRGNQNSDSDARRRTAPANHHTPSSSSSSSTTAGTRNPYAVYRAARAQSALSSPVQSPPPPDVVLPQEAEHRPSIESTGSRPPPPTPRQPRIPSRNNGRHPSVSSYIDLLEAAARLKRPPATYQGTPLAQTAAAPWPPPLQTTLSTTNSLQRFGPAPPRPPRSPLLPLQQQQQQQGNGPPGFTLVHECAFVLVVCIAQMLMLAGLAQALVPAAWIGASFGDAGARPADRAWYTAAYGLTAGTCVLPAGRLGDLAGHRRVFVAGFVWFGTWSLAAGCAGFVKDGSGSTLFIVARALQGIGPALLVPNGQAMLGRAYAPGPRKNVVMSLFGASAPAGFVAGAVLAAVLAERAWWPWAFWALAAACLVLAAVAQGVMPGAAPASNTLDAKILDDNPPSLWTRVDGAGMVLGVAGLVLANVAINQAPLVGWATPYTYFLLVIGVLLLAAFAYVEAVLAACPLIPRGVFRGGGNAFVLGCTGAGWGCFAVWVAYAVQTFEVLRGWTALRTAAAFAPAPVAGLAASLLTGLLLSRGWPPHAVMLASMLAFFVGSLIFATASPHTGYWLSPFFCILIMPFGMDMSNPAATILLSNGVARAQQGAAASLVVTVVNYAISVALGLAGTVEAATARRDDVLAGYRGAQYFGLGLGGLGVVLAAVFQWQSWGGGQRQ